MEGVRVEEEVEVEVEVNAASCSPETTTCGLLTFKAAAIHRNLSLKKKNKLSLKN